MGYAGRKLHTGKPSVQFDEGVVPERALLYSALPALVIMLLKGDRVKKTVNMLKYRRLSSLLILSGFQIKGSLEKCE